MATTVITETKIAALDEPRVQALVETEGSTITLVEAPAQVVVVESPDPIGPDQITEQITLTVQEVEPITLSESVDEITILNTDQSVTLTTTENVVLIEDTAIGPQGVPGPPGPTSVYIQPTQPMGAIAPYLWIQTGLGPNGEDWMEWFNDGTP